MKQCVVCEQPIAGQKQMYCSNACKQKGHYHRVKTQTNTYHSQTIRSLKRKLQLIELVGGGCRNCGYDANVAASHFHHPELALHTIQRILSGASRRETTG